MKVVLLAAGSSVHAVRWVNGLHRAGVEVTLVTQHDPVEMISPGIRVHKLPYSGELGYVLNAPTVRRILATTKPDLLNAHYASGYGTTARLSGFKPLVLSVWGSDVYDFPRKSSFHKWLAAGNLRSATMVASTSHAMARQARKIAPSLGEIAITPFGVDTQQFCPRQTLASDEIAIGTVKTMASKYGIDTLLEAFAVLTRRQSGNAKLPKLKLRLVGDGPDIESLKARSEVLGIRHCTEFSGRVPHGQVAAELRKLDIYVALSRLDSESFGVAVIEASACELPVVVSDVGGLPEVVDDQVTGIVVPKESPEITANALERLVLDADLRRSMGIAGRKRVEASYEWRQNVGQMIAVYEKVVENQRIRG